MSDIQFPYIQRKPGDPITAEDWNEIQVKTKEDIHDQIQTALQGLERVEKAGDAEKFGGKTPDQYSQELVDRILHELPKRTGYMMMFKSLKLQEESVVEHKLGACPLTDIYQLDYFRVICSEDEHIYESFTTFYLYHSSESKIRFKPEEATSAATVSIEIDPSDRHFYRIPFQRMLELYNVEYDDGMSLNDLETDFWKAFYSDPNDEFDDDQYCHSPWFDRCCREERTVKYLKQRKEWDDMWFQMRPRKTINFPSTIATPPANLPTRAPTNIQVVHFDFDTLGLTLLTTPELPANQTTAVQSSSTAWTSKPDPVKTDHLKVMVLLKV